MQSLLCSKIHEFSFVTLTYLCTDLSYLSEYFLYLSVVNFTPIIKVLVIETVIGHVNMYLVKAN